MELPLGEEQPRQCALQNRCDICHRTFARHEHLIRHLGSHTREKPFRCSTCGKHFGRQDILNRHLTSHKEEAEGVRPRGSMRACSECASSRIRCSRGVPCKRCSERDLTCEYPQKRPRAASSSSVGQVELPRYDSVHEPFSTVNWLSPSNDTVKDWDAQLASLYNIPSTFGSLGAAFDVQPAEEAGSLWDSVPAGVNPAAEITLSEHNSTNQSLAHHSSISGSSPTDSASIISTTSRYYVEGTGARAPFMGKSHKRRSKACTLVLSEMHPDTLSTADNCLDLVSNDAYEDLLRSLHGENHMHHLGIDMASFPPQAHIAVFAKLYFDKFHPTFPFLSKSSFGQRRANWILLLAVTTVGASYTRSEQSARQRETLFSILRIVLHHRFNGAPSGDVSATSAMSSTNECGAAHELNSVQARILNCVCMFHSGKPELMKQAVFEQWNLVEATHSLDLFSPTVIIAEPRPEDNATFVQHWLQAQSRLRAGFMIWFVDFLIAYESNRKPLMQVLDANAPLPCPEDIWENPSVDRIRVYNSVSTTLPEALETLYMEKRLPDGASEFAVALLIHAICRKTREVFYQSQTQLSEWIPSATMQPRQDRRRVKESWPPATPVLSDWRNSTCDSLDILHWAANGKAALSAGWEHPTILHLHIARLIILTPTSHLDALVHKPLGSHHITAAENDKQIRARSHATQWAIRDQFKARLAVIHAGALFWHIRRYSTDCVVEPYAIYIATLVVWAYSVAVQSVRRQGGHRPTLSTMTYVEQQAENSRAQGTCQAVPDEVATAEHDLDPVPLFVRLDRPCDDEMVQTYVRYGHRMTGYMLRVGDICSKDAPRKILLEGLRLLVGEGVPVVIGTPSNNTQTEHPLEGSDTWGIEQSYAASLRRLHEATRPR
ncbi:hypothetical protein K469DRAFT_582769 [Zopfia rhizophila CBS 207.26]|uniref:Uncharacterized protein n=1 Tax=Zopfia rhizophila CBS 207.26 TaxID=1314779 RepID=A0A6A6DV44_9PEZI|nr:hypothetical protein K469DRAFT_582769 [Zopfia rhizophila CBS 207.26]